MRVNVMDYFCHSFQIESTQQRIVVHTLFSFIEQHVFALILLYVIQCKTPEIFSPVCAGNSI